MDVLASVDFFTVEVLTRRGLITYYVLFFIARMQHRLLNDVQLCRAGSGFADALRSSSADPQRGLKDRADRDQAGESVLRHRGEPHGRDASAN